MAMLVVVGAELHVDCIRVMQSCYLVVVIGAMIISVRIFVVV